MARSITTSRQHAKPSPPSSTRGELKFVDSDGRLRRTARRLGRSKKKVLKHNAPFRMTVIFDLIRPLGFRYGWSSNIKPSDDETTYVDERIRRLLSAEGIKVTQVNLAQSDVEDTYNKGVNGTYLAVVEIS